MTEMWLVRHGQTEWNLAGRYQGQADIPLNETGIEQASALAKTLAGELFDIIFSSDLSRASQTAQIIADQLGLKIITDKRLREICQGRWEGLRLDEVKEKYAIDFAQGEHDPSTAKAPGGESVAEVASRMAAAADQIHRDYPDGRILVVSHGLAVSTLFCQAEGISLNHVYKHIPDNATPMKICWPAS